MDREPSGGRFRVPENALGGDIVTIPPAEARHMMVRRLGAGRTAVLFDGAGREAEVEILHVGADGGRARVLAVRTTATESPLRVCLVQALPVRLPRMDGIVRQCTELGVHAIVPVVATASRLPGGGNASLARRAERWRRLADAAAEQSGRSAVPQIAEPVTWARLDWSSLPLPAFLLDPSGPAGSFARTTRPDPPAATLLAGPEGGWSEPEIEGALAQGAERIGLGPRILRADSAGPAALAVLQHAWGDLAD